MFIKDDETWISADEFKAIDESGLIERLLDLITKGRNSAPIRDAILVNVMPMFPRTVSVMLNKPELDIKYQDLPLPDPDKVAEESFVTKMARELDLMFEPEHVAVIKGFIAEYYRVNPPTGGMH